MNTCHTWTALTALAVLCPAIALGGTRTYTSAQTVADTITGDDAIVVNVPNAYATTYDDNQASGWTGIVEFSGENSFTGGVTIQSGAVKISSKTALGTTGAITMYPHTALIIGVSFRDGEGDHLKEQIIDRIQVVNPSNEENVWVSFQVTGDGRRNSIDFSEQEFLYLSAPRSDATWQDDGAVVELDGTFTPYGDTYKFGYGFVRYHRACALQVNQLVDASDGTPRNVLFKGSSTTTIGWGWTLTGKIRIEDGAWVNFYKDYGFGANPATLTPDRVTVSGSNCALNPRCINYGTGGNAGITVNEGAELSIYMKSGENGEADAVTFWGPLCGSGTIKIYNPGCLTFASKDNTFSGTMNLESTGDGEQKIIIGGNDHFSWGEGGTFQFGDAADWKRQQTLVLATPTDTRFYGKVASNDSNDKIIKRGAGILTVTDRTVFQQGTNKDISIMIAEGAGEIKYLTNYEDGSAMTFSGELGPSADWGYYSDNSNANAYPITNAAGTITMVLNDGKAGTEWNAGTVQSPAWVNVKDAWNMHFTARLASTSEAEQRECKFALVFHQGGNTGTIGLGSQWDENEKTLCWKDGSAGFFIGSGHWNKYLAFFTNGKMVGTIATDNDMFLFDNLAANPLVVDVTFDGAGKVTAKFTRGNNTLTVESTELASYLKTNFEGGAHIALTSYFGNCIETGMSVDNFAFNHSWTPIPTVSGDISLMGGTVSLVADGATNGVVSATMDFTGATTLVSEGDATFDFTSDKWTFNFNGGTSPKITFPASAKLPSAVSVTIYGAKENLPKRWTPIVDMSSIAGERPSFTIADGSPSQYRLSVVNGVLGFRVAGGLVITFR